MQDVSYTFLFIKTGDRIMLYNISHIFSQLLRRAISQRSIYLILFMLGRYINKTTNYNMKNVIVFHLKLKTVLNQFLFLFLTKLMQMEFCYINGLIMVK